MTDLYKDLLEAANCNTTSCLRNISESEMSTANTKLIQNASPAFSFGPGIGFGPIIDGDHVPDIPDFLVKEGRYHRSIQKVLSANMAADANFGPSKSYQNP
jgi:hypothetical protein